MPNSRGPATERKVRKRLEELGYVVVKAGGSLGEVDLVAGQVSSPTLAIEVKSDDIKYGAFNNFGPADRRGLLETAAQAGWKPVLIYWPPRGEWRWLYPGDWPTSH